MKYDLVAIDIDGTLVNSVHQISPKVKEAVQRVVDAGAKIVLCTGRPFPGATRYMEELALTKEGDYIINYHGALAQRTDTGDIMVDHQLSYEDMRNWHELTNEYGVNFQAIRNDGVYMEGTDFYQKSLIESFLNEMPLRVRTLAEMDPEVTYSKFNLQDNIEAIEALQAGVPEDFHERYTVMRSEADSIEVLNKAASKGRTLRELADKLGVPQERVMAIGDSGNDIDMVEYAGLGIAMGNAVHEVLDVADVVTSTNDEDGVAEAIARYFFDETE